MVSLSKERKAFLILCIGYIISKAWTMLPESSEVHSFFPLYTIEMTTRTYAWILCSLAHMVITYVAITLLFEKLRGEIFIVCILYILDIPDYLIFYCEPLFSLGPLPVEYGLIKGIGICIITLTTQFK